jgi:hypothetical protein
LTVSNKLENIEHKNEFASVCYIRSYGSDNASNYD